jgi:hypothetical protein
LYDDAQKQRGIIDVPRGSGRRSRHSSEQTLLRHVLGGCDGVLGVRDAWHVGQQGSQRAMALAIASRTVEAISEVTLRPRVTARRLPPSLWPRGGNAAHVRR